MFDVVESLKLPGDVKVSVQTGWGMNAAADAATPTCTRQEGLWLAITMICVASSGPQMMVCEV